MTHTSRPWDREYIWNLLRIGKKSLNIVTNDGLNSPDEDDADLIAAAPEMLAVLERLEESAEYWSEYEVPIGIVEDIKASIAKARGEA